MKSSNHVGFFILFAMAFLPISAYSEAIPDRGPIPFAAYDKDNDGLISEKEFNEVRAERISKRAAEGGPMRGAANAPLFTDIDINNDGKIGPEEFAARQSQHRKTNRNKFNPSSSSDPQKPVHDSRKLVTMPERAKDIIRKKMQANLAALNAIIGYLASNDFESAAESAEKTMGKSTMGKHRGSGAAPGLFMPKEMRSLGRGMHEAASEFAEVAKQGDIKNSLKFLEKLTGSCVACHHAYRIR